MHMKSSAGSLVPALCLAALATGCGGGDAPTEPEPMLMTVHLDVGYIEVIEDCDGAEGDGDFRFRVVTWSSEEREMTELYAQVVNLGPGGKTPRLGRKSYQLEAVEGAGVSIRLTASELDRSIFDVTYHDDRLDNQHGSGFHEFRNGTWSHIGSQSLTLGTAGCQVKLNWTASVDGP